MRYSIIDEKDGRVQVEIQFQNGTKKYLFKMLFNTKVSLQALQQVQRGNYRPIQDEMRPLLQGQLGYADLHNFPDDVFLAALEASLRVVLDLEQNGTNRNTESENRNP